MANHYFISIDSEYYDSFGPNPLNQDIGTEFLKRLKERGFKIIFHKRGEKKLCCLAKHDQELTIKAFKGCWRGVELCSVKESPKKFKKGVHDHITRSQMLKFFFPEAVKKHYCSSVFQCNTGKQRRQYEFFMSHMKKMGFQHIVSLYSIADVIDYSILNSDIDIFVENVYKTSKQKYRIREIVRSWNARFSLFKHKSAEGVNNLKKTSRLLSQFHKQKECMFGLDLPEVIVHSIKNDPAVLRKEIGHILPAQDVFKEFMEMKFPDVKF